jgi:succinyl-diaminopimelate desuccinylase
VDRRIERLERSMVAFAARFCSIPTVNPPGQDYERCCEFLAAKLGALGLRTRIVRPPAALQAEVLPDSEDFPRPSVVARWDVGAERTLHFTGHYDVVPPTAGWRTDPFKPVIKGRRLIARGADDMKGANAAAIFAVQALRASRITPPWNLELSFTPDEETGGQLGLGYLVRSGQVRPDAAVLCEGGSGTALGYAHKGVLWLDVTVLGRPAHACNPRAGVNALEGACFLIGQLKTLEKAYATRSTAFRMDRAAAKRPTLMIGGVAGGGGKVNTIPDRFHFTIDRRLLPEEKVSAVRSEILAVIRRACRRRPSLRARVRTLLHVPPGFSDLEAEICRIAAAAVRDVHGKRARFRMSAGFTDMHFLTQEARVPTVMYGTRGAGAHADNEYCRIDSMREAARFYARLALGMPAE